MKNLMAGLFVLLFWPAVAALVYFVDNPLRRRVLPWRTLLMSMAILLGQVCCLFLSLANKSLVEIAPANRIIDVVMPAILASVWSGLCFFWVYSKKLADDKGARWKMTRKFGLFAVIANPVWWALLCYCFGLRI